MYKRIGSECFFFSFEVLLQESFVKYFASLQYKNSLVSISLSLLFILLVISLCILVVHFFFPLKSSIGIKAKDLLG